VDETGSASFPVAGHITDIELLDSAAKVLVTS
jgi:hypothetical protein